MVYHFLVYNQIISSDTKEFTLTMSDGLTSSTQVIEFRAEAGTAQGANWSSYITFTFPAGKYKTQHLSSTL